MTAKTGLVFDDCFLKHLTGPGHPERAERLRAVGQALNTSGIRANCVEIPVREATDDELLAVHTQDYLIRLRTACENGARFIDCHDSEICRDSDHIARLAAGSVLEAVDQVIAGKLHNAFCAVRPPGHHCEQAESMGFCLLANVAIAAKRVLNRHGLERVAVVDWDVHHGNGTQHIFEESAEVLVCSIHGHPDHVYPGTGYESETGRGAGQGATLNVTMMPGEGDDAYRKAFDTKILPKLDEFKPQFVFISAGFDAHERDPLAPINLPSESFAWMTDRVMEIAASHSNGRVVSVLEGGYDLQGLSESVCQHVSRLQNIAAD